MMKGLQATVTELQRDQAGSLIAGRPCPPFAAHLPGVWCVRTREETLPQRPPAFKHPRLTVTFANRWPRANLIRGRDHKMTERTPMESADTEWQAPQRSRRPQGLPNHPACLPDRFTELPEEVVKEDLAYLQKYPKQPSQSQKITVVSKTKKWPAV